MTSTVVCPACESENVETIRPPGRAADAPEYRCLDCGTECDDDGPLVVDADDPHAP